MKKLQESVFFDEVTVSERFGFTYSLSAVAVHKGRFGSGHYVTYVQDSDGKWVLIDDVQLPVEVPFERVQRSQAYLLVFRLVAAP